MSLFIQFDGELSDTKSLLDELKQKGVKVLAVHRSRWRGENGEDKGGRIDIEIEDDGGTHEESKNKILTLESEMDKSNKWTKKGKAVK